MRCPWTPDTEEMLSGMWGEYRAPVVAALINRRYGTTYTRSAVLTRARVLGLTTTENRGEMSVSEASREFGVARFAIVGLLRRRGFKLGGAGRCRFVPENAVDVLRSHYGAKVGDGIPIKTAADRLGYSLVWLRCLCRRGVFRSYVVKGRAYISADEVSRHRMKQVRAAK